MKHRNIITLFVGLAASLSVLTGCALVKALEKEITVSFVNEGEVIQTGVVTQYQNIKSPIIDEAYVPEDYRFLGWTCYEESQLDLSNATKFKTQYIAGGRMVHYMEVKPFAKDGKVTCQALILHKDDIPKDYHYAVLAWYDKVANSGLTQSRMDTYEGMLKNYLAKQGVSEEDIASVVVRGYAGNVGPTTGQILYDDDVDIMFGWGSLDNITTTGSIPVEMVQETVNYTITYEGTAHNRTIHRLTDNPGCLQVMTYLQSEESVNFFNS